jgi:hypothetical protein
MNDLLHIEKMAAWKDRMETILLVEDEAFVRDVTREILQAAGYRVLTAGDGVAAKRLYDQFESEVALLLTDMILPGESGGELAAGMNTLFNPCESGSPLLLVRNGSGSRCILRLNRIDGVHTISFLRRNADANTALADRWFGSVNHFGARGFLGRSNCGLRPPIKRARLRVASRKRRRIVGERKSLLMKTHLRYAEIVLLQCAGNAGKLRGEQ